MAKAAAPFAYAGLDRVFHEKARLGIVTSLVGTSRGLSFSELKSSCGLTDGNLNRHLQVLVEAEFVEIERGYDGNRSHTRYALTHMGRLEFLAYLEVLEGVVARAQEAAAMQDRKGKFAL